GIPFVFQGNSSGVAHAISDAVQKHNERNAGNRVLYLNYSAVDPALTNEKCHYWHFRFDAHADMKMAALTDVIAANKNIKKMYIIGQDYSFGKAVADGAVAMLGKKRPDIQIVGNELHPIGKVKDFSPYVQKIVASGADAVITGNWGAAKVARRWNGWSPTTSAAITETCGARITGASSRCTSPFTPTRTSCTTSTPRA